jgi:hypothetical protein
VFVGGFRRQNVVSWVLLQVAQEIIYHAGAGIDHGANAIVSEHRTNCKARHLPMHPRWRRLLTGEGQLALQVSVSPLT